MPSAKLAPKVIASPTDLGIDDGLLRALVAVAKRDPGADSELPTALPTDVTTLKKNGLPVFRVPTGAVHTDRDTHPFTKTPALIEHLNEFTSSDATPSILVGPSEDGSLKVVKGHDTLLAAKLLGIPYVHAAMSASTPAEAAGQVAESHFFPKNDSESAVMARDASDDSRELPEKLEGESAPAARTSVEWFSNNRLHYPGQ